MNYIEMQETAAVLLRLLGGSGQAAAAPGHAQPAEEATAQKLFFAPDESEPGALRSLQDALELQSAERQRALRGADAAVEEVSAADAQEKGTAAQYSVALHAAAAAVGKAPDMDAISEFFRRDSRRYDNGF